MIALALALVIQAGSDEVELLGQAAAQIMDSQQALSFRVGRCSQVYPEGMSDPYVLKAQQSIAEIGLEPLTMATTRLHQLRFAEGAEDAGAYKSTRRECLNEISEAAQDLEQQVQGFNSLARHLNQRR